MSGTLESPIQFLKGVGPRRALLFEHLGVRTVEDLLRVVEIAVFNLLGAENSIAQARALLHAALVGAKLLETGELAERLAALEAAHRKDEEARVPSTLPGGLLGEPDL